MQKYVPLQCDNSRSRCTASPVSEFHQDNTTHTEVFETSTDSTSAESEAPVKISQSPSEGETALPNTSPLLLVPSENTDLISHPDKNQTLEATNHITNMYLHLTIPNTTSEDNYANELYDGDEDYEEYDLEGSLPNYPDIKCTRKGLQCADRTIIMDCSENSSEPLFTVSCASLLHSDDGENATGHCDNETPSCILSSQGMTLSLNIKTINTEDSKICKFYSGLQCINNDTLVACSGYTNNIHYAISCDGMSTSDTSSFLQGQCYENSCVFVIAQHNRSSEILAYQINNYETYHLLAPDANKSVSEHLHSKTGTEINTTDIQGEQFQVFDLHRDDFIHSLSKINEHHLVDDHGDTEIHTANSSSGEYTDLITETAENIIKTDQDNLPQTDDLTSAESTVSDIGEPTTDLALLPQHTENSPEVTESEGTDFYSETSSTLNVDYIKIAFENNVNTAIPDHKIPTSASKIRYDISETILTQAPNSIPTEAMMSITKGIRGETPSPVPEMIPAETTTHVSKLSQTETDFSTPETLPTETVAPVSKVLHRKKFSPVPVAIPTETIVPMLKSGHTESDFSVSETLPTEIITTESEVMNKETAPPALESTPTETMIPVSKASHHTEMFSVTETLPTETMIYVSKLIYKENSPLAPEMTPTGTTPMSKPSDRETTFSNPKILSAETLASVSKAVHKETVSPIPVNVPTETMVPVSKSTHTETSFSAPNTLPADIHSETSSTVPATSPTKHMTPTSKFIHTETAFSFHEVLPKETVTHVCKSTNTESAVFVPKTLPTKTTTPISEETRGRTASPLLKTIFTEATNFNSNTVTPASQTTMLILETPLKIVTDPMSKPIAMLGTQEADGDSNKELRFNLQTLGTVPTAQVASEATALLPAVEGSGPTRMGTKSPTAETDQSQHVIPESSPAMNGPFKVPDTQQNLGDFQKYACRKAGIQCMDGQTLAACLPDLTLSYTVSCHTLLPYVTSKRHVVYCDHELESCALAYLD